MALRAALLALLASSLALGLAGSDESRDRAASASTGLLLGGTVRVIDADTFDVGTTRVRLHGIDAPERDQSCQDASGLAVACGESASAFARARWEGREATCEGIDRDAYGREVARCRVAGEDVGATLVASGYAYAYVEYATDYLALQEAAEAAGAGLFAGRFDPPWDFRQARSAREAEVDAAAAPTGCAIKGNVSDRGRIYHLPGSSGYDRTRIDEGAGERWFCSEGEARAAGWRAPRG